MFETNRIQFERELRPAMLNEMVITVAINLGDLELKLLAIGHLT